MSSIYKINNPSLDLIHQALKTLPVKPFEGNINYRAYNISIPSPEQESHSSYFYECQEKRILPLTESNYFYTPILGIFHSPKGITLQERLYAYPLELQKKVQAQLLVGGRAHILNFHFSSPQEYPFFLENLSESLDQKKYTLHFLNLVLHGNHVGNYASGLAITAHLTYLSQPIRFTKERSSNQPNLELTLN